MNCGCNHYGSEDCDFPEAIELLKALILEAAWQTEAVRKAAKFVEDAE